MQKSWEQLEYRIVDKLYLSSQSSQCFTDIRNSLRWHQLSHLCNICICGDWIVNNGPFAFQNIKWDVHACQWCQYIWKQYNLHRSRKQRITTIKFWSCGEYSWSFVYKFTVWCKNRKIAWYKDVLRQVGTLARAGVRFQLPSQHSQIAPWM